MNQPNPNFPPPKSAIVQSDMIGRENPHTQAAAISWLVGSLYSSYQTQVLADGTKTLKEIAVNWLIDYENYPMDSLLKSLKLALIRLQPQISNKILAKEILGAYYERKC